MIRLITIINIANGITPEVDLNKLGYAVTGYGIFGNEVDWREANYASLWI